MGTLLVAVGLAGWLWATVAANPPMRDFERLRRHRLPFRVWLPGWRFFSPNPDGFDFALLYRVCTTSGAASAWDQVRAPRERAWWQMAVNPGKREAKSLNHAMQAVIKEGRHLPRRAMKQTPTYRLLETYVRRHVAARHAGDSDVCGFQFTVVRHAGYDEEPGIQCWMVSAFAPLEVSGTGAL